MQRSPLLEQFNNIQCWPHGAQPTAAAQQPWVGPGRGAPQQLVGARRDQRAAPAVGRRPDVAALARPPVGVAPHQPPPARAERCLRPGWPGMHGATLVGTPHMSARAAPAQRCPGAACSGPGPSRGSLWRASGCGAFQRGRWLCCPQPAQLKKHGDRQSVPAVCTVAAQQRRRQKAHPPPAG